ncbi:MAG: FHA domain-containing protein [Pseudonocardia sp.]|nr:FHA domain-containing protein [Pseudonocardia sp.]
MASCEAGHRSDSDDYCDVCGRPIQGAPSTNVSVDASAGADPTADVPRQCAKCGAPLDGRFCEACGQDATAPVAAPTSGPAAPGCPERCPGNRLYAVVRADRSWYEEVRGRHGPDAEAIEFPQYCPDRRFPLDGERLAIGRRSRSRGTQPDIDLSGPPTDPGISAQQALLIARPDGGWDIVDLQSTNGTSVGNSSEPIPPGVPVPLSEGDRIRLGAWTTITITSAPAD